MSVFVPGAEVGSRNFSSPQAAVLSFANAELFKRLSRGRNADIAPNARLLMLGEQLVADVTRGRR
jgi:hypothetical protein